MSPAGSPDRDAPPPGARPVPEFAATGRVRFDEAGPDGLVRTSTLLRLAQDVAWQHATAIGLTRHWYDDRGLVWLVRAVDLRLYQAIPAGAALRFSTAVTGHRRIWARRRVVIDIAGGPGGSSGGPAAAVLTDWVLTDLAGRPLRIPDWFGDLFGALPGSEPLTRVAVDEAPPGTTSVVQAVRRHELDPNGHVNNGVHLDWIEALIDPAAVAHLPRRYRIEYRAPIGPEAAVAISAWSSPGSWLARIARDGPSDGPSDDLAVASLEPI